MMFVQVIDPDRDGKNGTRDSMIINPDRNRVHNPRTPIINPCLRLNSTSGKMEWDDRLCPWRRR
jgi:hypothetical protein